jgi:uncharacterized protein (DUF427 family)
MAKAIWNYVIIAECDTYEKVEGNIYFPPECVDKQYLKPSNTITSCSWKGIAKYYSLEVNGEINPDAAWYYPEPREAAKNIKGYIAFWKGVEIIE